MKGLLLSDLPAAQNFYRAGGGWHELEMEHEIFENIDLDGDYCEQNESYDQNDCLNDFIYQVNTLPIKLDQINLDL